MNINTIIPNTSNWKVKPVKGYGGLKAQRVFKHSLAWFPIMDVYDDYTLIFLDIRWSKDIIDIVSKIETDFYFISPLYSDPGHYKEEDDLYHQNNIKNYLVNYSKSKFFHGFQKVEFDLINNLVKYCKKWDCLLLLKDIYDEVNRMVQLSSYDYYQNKNFYEHPTEIREEFGGLYRQIKLAELFN